MKRSPDEVSTSRCKAEPRGGYRRARRVQLKALIPPLEIETESIKT
jgi:hypothetical protein